MIARDIDYYCILNAQLDFLNLNAWLHYYVIQWEILSAKRHIFPTLPGANVG